MSNLIHVFNKHPNWPEVKEIILILNKFGAKAYLAGGCVRDALLDRQPKDFDIATSAMPEEILQLFPNSTERGKAFGVVAVSCSNGPVEVATFRKDGPYTDGRHPESVEFLSDKEDALRRDFTVNALFYNLKEEKIIDYVNGVKDLKNQIICTVGEPEKRFKEDHLRILRAVRFSIQLGFKLDVLTEKTLFEMKDTLQKISKERVYEECLKILKTGDFTGGLSAFKKLNLLKYFLGMQEDINWDFCLDFWKSSVPISLLQEKTFLWMMAFYPLLIQKEKDILNKEGKWNPDLSRRFKIWKIPLTIIKQMNSIFYSSCCLMGIRKASLGKKLRMLDSTFLESISFLSRNYLNNKGLNTNIIDKIEKEFITRSINGQLHGPLVNGDDLKALGIPEDQNMSRILEELYDLQLEKQIKEKDALLKHLH